MHPINPKSFGETGILALFSNGTALISGWVKKQVGSSRYIVTDGTVTKTCTLAQTTDEATTLPAGTCTFALSHTLNASDQFVNNLDSTRCSTTQGNSYAWHTGAALTGRVVNDVQYDNLEQGAIHAGPISGGTIAASFTLTKTTKIRVRLLLTLAEDYGDATFTIALNPDDSTSPNLGTSLASQTFSDTVLSSTVLLEFTNVSTVSLTPGRYWISLTDNYSSDPLTSSGAAWFWDSNLVDSTVVNEYNYSNIELDFLSSNIDDSTAFQMCVEAIS